MHSKRVQFVIAIALVAAVFAIPARADQPAGADEPAITDSDAALIREALHLQAKLGEAVWPGWSPSAGPILYRTGTHEVMIGARPVPASFERRYSAELGDSIYVRASDDTGRYRAAFPFEGVWTAVLSRPAPDDHPARWTLEAAHELFHLWQADVRPLRLIDPFTGPHADKNELTFPYPHDDASIGSLARLEAEAVFGICAADTFAARDARITVNLLNHANTVAAGLFADSLAADFKRWMEWNEGVARYTERELAALASDPARYSPAPAFAAHYPDATYAELWDHAYARALNPIRFIGEGVRGHVTFYYMGMGKAYLLDKLLPGWKSHYFTKGLDALIQEAKSAPSCAVD